MKPQLVFEAKNLADTDLFGAALAACLPPRTTVALLGTLGAGKTRFVQAFAAALRVPRETVVSPTFVLCQEYYGDRTLFHLDAYRLESPAEFAALGPEEMFQSPGIVLIEWADRVAELLPDERLEIQIEVVGETERRFTVTAFGQRLEPAMRCLEEKLHRPATELTRRHLLVAAVTTVAGAGVVQASQTMAGQSGGDSRPRRVLLRSSWQTVNIGDIAHTPGVLRLLEQHLPTAEVWLWPSKLDNGVDAMLRQRFPKLRIVSGGEVEQAFRDCDFLLHGSGPSLVAEKDVVRWREATGKPYGIYGITLPSTPSTATQALSDGAIRRTIEVLSGARFAFFRDSVSLELAKQRGCRCPVMEFGPDGAFATDLRDDQRATAFLKQHGLEDGQFLCCIPRLRYTPYWTIPAKKTPFDETKHRRNEEMKEHDHAQLRAAIVRIAKETELRVLVCPEDQTQMAVGKELLVDPLPPEVRDRVVWRPDYWLTGEAVSTYVRSAGLFGNEMHSPIMCIGHGIPAIVCRWKEQTSKGTMWRDIGLGDWLFDLDDETQVSRVVPTVMELATDLPAAREKAARARSFVERRQRETMGILAREL